MNNQIDFVVTWVDQQDKKWLKRYKDNVLGNSSEELIRFRDYGTLKYLFRGIEENAPWVRRVFLVTDGQIPDWLNMDNPKIEIVDHKQIIDGEYLPTFNSNVIDWNLHKIPNLSENFVYFNDDMFLVKKTTPEDFFGSNGFPKDTFASNAIMPNGDFDHIFINNITVINAYFDKKTFVMQNLNKVFNVKNGPWNFITLVIMVFPRFTRFYDAHTTISFKKSMVRQVLTKNPQIQSFFNNKTRGLNDYSIWLVRYWQMLLGKFSVRNYNFGTHIQLSNLESIEKQLFGGTSSLLNINDSDDLDDQKFQETTSTLTMMFEKKFPNKSSYEL